MLVRFHRIARGEAQGLPWPVLVLTSMLAALAPCFAVAELL